MRTLLILLGAIGCGPAGSLNGQPLEGAGLLVPPADLAPVVGLPQRPDGGATPPPPFSEATVSAGSYVGSIAVGDLDGDGISDLVTANRNDFVGSLETFSEILSNGDGTFKGQLKYAAPLYPQTVALADFNGDGVLDVATDSGTSFDVRMNLGGVFGAPLAYADYTKGGWAFEAADLNGDGKVDLVSSVFLTSTVAVRLGAGDGTFAEPVVNVLSMNVDTLKAGDFNEDGYVDVVYTSMESRTYGIALGGPDGRLVEFFASPMPSNGYPIGLAVGDVDGDGHLDFVMSSYNSSLIVVLGDGRGGLQAPTSYSSHADGIVVGDFNLDGRPDVVTTDYWGKTLNFFAGVGGGWLADPVTLPVSTELLGPLVISAGDFDHDGRPDLAVGCSLSDQVLLLFNRSP